ncbi:MAG: hydrogenase nickel incorporation protein HypB, partial [Rubrobacteridae bacterium]|nr:hydrogenase nickel incorporation protein HypB [Rubrobacteridae bacterium]
AKLFGEKGIFAINLMASPGAGKTSFILETAKRLKDVYIPAVIEGDIASKVDTEKVRAHGIQSVQINTGGACHLEANMIKQALDHMTLDDVNLLIIENVGNLVCPADFSLGETARVVILSVPEGDDKPLKYPSIFAGASVVIINKIDMMQFSDFDMERLNDAVLKLNPSVEIIPLSCRTGEGFDLWTKWLVDRIEESKAE